MKKGTNLLEGSIWKGIVSFAIPLFLGNLFQQLYNTADSLIVGNFLGSDALAAVSSSGSLIFLMVGFFNGIAVGAGVVISKYFGAADYEGLKKAVHTNIAFGLVSGCILTAVGMILAPQILVLMGTPESVLPNSIVYFRVYFAGSVAFVMYNMSIRYRSHRSVFIGECWDRSSESDCRPVCRTPSFHLPISSCRRISTNLV